MGEREIHLQPPATVSTAEALVEEAEVWRQLVDELVARGEPAARAIELADLLLGVRRRRVAEGHGSGVRPAVKPER